MHGKSDYLVDMKYYTLIPFVLFLACHTTRNSETKLSGEYVIGDYAVTTGSATSPAGVRLIHSLGRSNWQFRFVSDDSVVVLPSFGMEYLGDSTFHYKLEDDTLVLTNHNNIRKLRFTDQLGLIRLYCLHPDIASFAMMKLHKQE